MKTKFPALCVAVRKVREKSGETQEQFAHRLKMGSMTISRFERGVATPSDGIVLQKLCAAAKELEMKAEADMFDTAYMAAVGVEIVNRMYPGPGPREQALTIRFETLREWKAMVIALFSERYRAEIGAVRAVVNQVVRDADISQGIGPEGYHELEARVKTLMEEREQRIDSHSN